MKSGHKMVYELAEIHGNDTKLEDFASKYKAKYPWISSKSTGSVFSQGMYYAWKDMGF